MRVLHLDVVLSTTCAHHPQLAPDILASFGLLPKADAAEEPRMVPASQIRPTWGHVAREPWTWTWTAGLLSGSYCTFLSVVTAQLLAEQTPVQ